MTNNVQTLNDYVDLLRTNQQEYIVWCIQQYTERKDFHRGLLPFITTREVSEALKIRLQVLKDQILTDETIKYPVGVKFIRSIMSVIEAELLKKLCEEDASTIMFLKTVKIAQMMGRKFDTEVALKLATLYGTTITTMDGWVQLKMVGKDKWKVTCHKKALNVVTTWLAERFR